MAKFLVILLSLSILILTSGKTLVLVNYVINKDYISKNLCVNKSKPKMKCNGKCHLMKELQKEEKKEQSPFGMKEKIEVQLFNSLCSVSTSVLSFVKIKHTTIYSQNYSSLNSASIFHPPQA